MSLIGGLRRKTMYRYHVEIASIHPQLADSYVRLQDALDLITETDRELVQIIPTGVNNVLAIVVSRRQVS